MNGDQKYQLSVVALFGAMVVAMLWIYCNRTEARCPCADGRCPCLAAPAPAQPKLPPLRRGDLGALPKSGDLDNK